MLMPIALANQGFIDVKSNDIDDLNLLTSDTFIDCLKKILNFEEIDINDFNGNTCNLIVQKDPSNSLFIYTNDTGTFLYQITSASPVTHLNNFLWFCNCVQIVSLDEINEILSPEKASICIVSKNLAGFTYNIPATQLQNYVTPNVKGNFRKVCVDSESILKINQINLLKIKCYVDPTASGLQTQSPDGSYNFLFPIQNLGTKESALFTSKIKVGSSVLNLADVISTFYPNIKSIEFLPFLPDNDAFYNSGCKVISNENQILELDLNGNAIFTPAGIFVPVGFTNSKTQISWDIPSGENFTPQLVMGGGVRIYFSTPLGNIEANINSVDYYGNGSNLSQFEYMIKEEGFILKGVGTVQVPPHYLNFYTDNAGQIFIQNLTTTAQELRKLERENVAKQEEAYYNFEQKEIINAIDTTANAIGAGLFGAPREIAAGAVRAGEIAIEYGYDTAKINRDYNRSLVEYQDNLKTQNLLSTLQGNQVSGEMSLISFSPEYNFSAFRWVIEKNYIPLTLEGGVGKPKQFITQYDYDYSIDYSANTFKAPSGSFWYPTLNPSRAVGGFYFRNVATLMAWLFGYSSSGNYPNFLNENVGQLSYSIVFELKNIYDLNENYDLKTSGQLFIPIRKKGFLLKYD